MANSPFPIDPALSAIAIAYKNPAYIADMVAPRIRVAKQEFKFLQYADDQFFNIPDTRVGRRSKPNEVELNATEVTDSATDWGLESGVPQSDIDNSDERYDPLGVKTAFLQELIDLDREKRVADMIFNPASYPVLLRQTLAGGSQFSDFVNSDPIGVINAALDEPLVRPTQMVFGQASWSKFRANPKIVKAVQGNAGDSGNATREQVAQLFELDEVLVGAGRANSAKPGQAAALFRLWGKHIALLHKAPVPDAEGAVQFCGTFQWGDRIAGQWDDKNIGLRGGKMVRNGESLKERIIANQAGYLLQNVVQ
jgi:hypothetical protein